MFTLRTHLQHLATDVFDLFDHYHCRWCTACVLVYCLLLHSAMAAAGPSVGGKSTELICASVKVVHRFSNQQLITKLRKQSLATLLRTGNSMRATTSTGGSFPDCDNYIA